MNQHERQRIHNIVDALNVPRGRFVLSGSAVMVLAGMERTPRDIDIFVATASWFSLYKTNQWGLFVTDPDDATRRSDPPYLYRDMFGIEVNVFHGWRRRGIGDIDVAFWIHNATEYDGVPCIPLAFLLEWKETMGRSKDVADIAAIRQHLEPAA